MDDPSGLNHVNDTERLFVFERWFARGVRQPAAGFDDVAVTAAAANDRGAATWTLAIRAATLTFFSDSGSGAGAAGGDNLSSCGPPRI